MFYLFAYLSKGECTHAPPVEQAFFFKVAIQFLIPNEFTQRKYVQGKATKRWTESFKTFDTAWTIFSVFFNTCVQLVLGIFRTI